jgi:hypothetical protein
MNRQLRSCRIGHHGILSVDDSLLLEGSVDQRPCLFGHCRNHLLHIQNRLVVWAKKLAAFLEKRRLALTNLILGQSVHVRTAIKMAARRTCYDARI